MAYFPMMVSLTGQNCLVVGGGKVALRKIQVLLDFGARVRVVAPVICQGIRDMEGICWEEKAFSVSDLENIALAVAATDDAHCNHAVSLLCRERRIPVNAADHVEDCTFIFPAYWKQGEVVASFSSGGQSPLITQYLKQETQKVIPPHLEEMAEVLGELRDTVKKQISPESRRKEFYRAVFALGLEREEIPSQEDIDILLKQFEHKEN